MSHAHVVIELPGSHAMCVLCSSFRPVEGERKTMVEQEPTSSAGQRLGAPESLGISTLESGQKPPAMPAGRHVAIRVRMLDDSEEIFDISVSASFIFHLPLYNLQSEGSVGSEVQCTGLTPSVWGYFCFSGCKNCFFTFLIILQPANWWHGVLLRLVGFLLYTYFCEFIWIF